MAALEAAALSIFSLNNPFSYTKSCLSPKLAYSTNVTYSSNSSPSLFCNLPARKLRFQVCSSVQDTIIETKPEQIQKENVRRKLYVFNLPWSFSVQEIKKLFAPCGTVSGVEIIKHKDGKNRNFAFVTMASPEEAQAAVNQLDTQEISGRIIRIEFAKKFKKPRPPRSASPAAGESQHKLYVSNLAWKVRSSHLKEFFSSNFNPLSTKIVFESNEGRSAGYGFVAFATKQEAEAAISYLDGKELMGRAVRLKISEKNDDVSEDNKEECDASEDHQPAES